MMIQIRGSGRQRGPLTSDTTGATGDPGGLVLEALLERCVSPGEVVAMVRHPKTESATGRRSRSAATRSLRSQPSHEVSGREHGNRRALEVPRVARDDGFRSGPLGGYHLACILEVGDAEGEGAKHICFIERRHGKRRKKAPESRIPRHLTNAAPTGGSRSRWSRSHSLPYRFQMCSLCSS